MKCPSGWGEIRKLPFGALQVQTHPFAIDQHEALIDELLSSAVISFVAEESGRGKNELDRFRACTRRSRKPHAGAEIDSIEIGDGELDRQITQGNGPKPIPFLAKSFSLRRLRTRANAVPKKRPSNFRMGRETGRSQTVPGQRCRHPPNNRLTATLKRRVAEIKVL